MPFYLIKANLYVLLATVLVAGSFLASEKLTLVLNPYSLTLLRFVGSFIIMAPFILLNKQLRKNIMKVIPKAMIISFFYSFYFVAMFEALKTTTVVNTGTLYTLVPFFTALLTLVIFKEKIPKKQFFVYFIAFIGTLWVIFKGDLTYLKSFELNSGDIIFLIGSLSMCCYSISIKLLYKNENIFTLVFCTLIGGMIWMSLALFVFNEPLGWGVIQGTLVLNMLYLILGTTILTLYLYQTTTVILGPKMVMSYVYLNPIAVVLLLYIIDGVKIDSIIIPGIIFSCISTYLLQRSISSQKV